MAQQDQERQRLAGGNLNANTGDPVPLTAPVTAPVPVTEVPAETATAVSPPTEGVVHHPVLAASPVLSAPVIHTHSDDLSQQQGSHQGEQAPDLVAHTPAQGLFALVSVSWTW